MRKTTLIQEIWHEIFSMRENNRYPCETCKGKRDNCFCDRYDMYIAARGFGDGAMWALKYVEYGEEPEVNGHTGGGASGGGGIST